MSEQKVVLVTGATGNQGRAVIDALLADGDRWHVRALTRSPEGKKARALAARGVEIHGGDLANAESLKPALAGAYGAFSVQNSQAAGLAKEELQGVMFADAALAAGVKHFIYTSVGGADRDSGVPHFDTKFRIEQHIKSIGLPATVLRPVSFMEGFGATGIQGAIGLGIFSSAVSPAKKMQMVAVRDIGIFARIAWGDPERFIGRGLELAGDELTIPDVIATIKQVTGKRSVFRIPIPAGLTKRMGDPGKMIIWIGEYGYRADIPALREVYPDMLSFEGWLRQHRS